MTFEIIDVFENFKHDYHARLTPESLFHTWFSAMQVAPTLRDWCIQEYLSAGEDWVQIAHQTVFTRTHQDYVRMRRIHERLKALIPELQPTLKAFYAYPKTIKWVLYHGLGNAAGWSTPYQGAPAILCGIEKIAALDWSSDEELLRLCAHEYAHVVHEHLRGPLVPTAQREHVPVLKLYVEGFASYYETFIAALPERVTRWEKDCALVLDDLKRIYAQALIQYPSVCDKFFGAESLIYQLPDTGYYLGKQWVKTLAQTYDFESLATLPIETLERSLEIFLTGHS